MWKRIPKALCCMLSLIFVLGMVGCTEIKRQQAEVPEEYQADGTEYDAMLKSTTGFFTVAETDRFRLDIQKRYTEIRLINKLTGAEWYSNPQGRFDGTEGNQSRISSQVVVQYLIGDSPYYYYSYGDAVSNDQYSFSQIKDGIRVNYIFGEKRKDYIVPQVLSIERYEEVMSALSEDDRMDLEQYYELVSIRDDSMDRESQALILEKFPVLAERDCYICQLRTSITDTDSNMPFANDFLMNKLEGFFLKAGYSAEKLAEDNELNRITKAMFADYSMALSVEYTLDDNGLVVRIPQDSIAFDDSLISIMSLQLLPYFGAADTTENGYIFVPDGSGALINLNNGKINADAYNKPVYGVDYTIPSPSSQLSSEQIHLPVFGLKADNKAFLGIIESGDGIARINADVSGKGSAYNTVGVTFCVNSSQSPATQALNAYTSYFYQEHITRCDYTVRYLFLHDEKATYTGMALAYQEYLADRNLLNKVADVKIPSIYLNILQAVDSKQLILGLPFDRPLPLTTCEQTIDILKQLHAKGADNISLQLSGWANNGVNHTAMNHVSWMNCLGGRKGYLSIVEYLNEQKADLYATCDFLYVNDDRLFDGFADNKNGSRTLENVAADGVVSPAYYHNLISKFAKVFPTETYGGLALEWMGCDLNGDYHSGKMIDRQATLETIKEELQYLMQQGYSLVLPQANAYVFGNTSWISEAPISSSKENLFDSSIPFYQIVLHGYIPCSSEPLNQVSNYEETVLKIIETGTIPSFLWIYEENSILKETEYSNYYSVNYRPWLEKAADLYEKIENILKDCKNVRITSHQELTEGVYCTTYENGVSVYVNYTEKNAVIDSIEIPAKGYKRTGGK